MNIKRAKQHTYKPIDRDGTVECTRCGLRNSNPTRKDYIGCFEKK